jgi:DNA-binding response OmpR family regulator
MRVVLLAQELHCENHVAIGLIARGFDVATVTDSTALYLELLHRRSDILVIDLKVPQEQGFAVARHLRSIEATQFLGIIMLALQEEVSSRIAGLTSGADIYLVKPINIEELSVYIRNLRKRLKPAETKSDAVFWRLFQTEWRLVSPTGSDIELSHLEAAFMKIVAQNAGKPVKRKDIIMYAFGKDPLSYDNRRLEAVVSRLRRKVHRIYPLSQPIKVVHSVGYVFTDSIVCN